MLLPINPRGNYENSCNYGSPRGESGCTAKMLKYILGGMEQGGAETEIACLNKLKIHHCIRCFNCWIKTPGKCAYNDDMVALLQKYIEADFIILATPLYVYNVSGLMKNFIDRIIPLGLPLIEESKSRPGVTVHPMRYPASKPKKLLLVSSCGFASLHTSQR